MSWLLRHRTRRFLRSSLSAAPIASMLAALAVAPLIRWIDEQTRWTLFGFAPAGASAVVSALASSLLSLIVFSFSILLLAIQVAGGQLSPRVIARVFRARILRTTLAAFVFSYTYSLAALSRIGDRVPQLPVALAIASSLTSVALFIVLVQRMGENFRPGTVMTRVAAETRQVIDAMYPDPFSPQGGEHARLDLDLSRPDRIVVQPGQPGVVLAFDMAGLAAMAERAGCIIELVPEVGDFVAVDEPLFLLHGPGAASLDEQALRQSVALGIERTLEQDPAFGFRIIVDIASKALSPAINDPTTGVLAIDQLHHLLHLLSRRELDTGVVRDGAGRARLIYRTPDWEDFVTLAATEVRVYGATSPQVTRRLQAMFEHLVRVVPPERAGILRNEIALLEATIGRGFSDPGDRAIAGIRDLQGFGSRQRK